MDQLTNAHQRTLVSLASQNQKLLQQEKNLRLQQQNASSETQAALNLKIQQLEQSRKEMQNQHQLNLKILQMKKTELNNNINKI